MKEKTQKDVKKDDVNEEEVKEAKKSLRLDELIKDEDYSKKKIEEFKHNDIYIKMLSSEEKSRVSELADKFLTQKTIDEESGDEVFEQVKDQYEVNKCAILAYTIVEINDGKFNNDEMTEEDFENFYQDLKKLKYVFTDMIFNSYRRMNDKYFEDMADLDEFKKKLPKNQQT